MKLDVFYKEKCIQAFKDIEVDTYFLHLFHSWYSTIYIDKTNDNLRQLIIFEESKTFFFIEMLTHSDKHKINKLKEVATAAY